MSALFAPNAGGAVGDVARAVSPQVAYRIGQYFKENNQEGSASHLLAHALLGAAVSAATGNDVAIGALSGATSEKAAPALATYLFGTNDPEKLTQEQKDTITSIITLGTAGIAYGASDGSVVDAVNASEVGKVGVENNATYIDNSNIVRRVILNGDKSIYKCNFQDDKCINNPIKIGESMFEDAFISPDSGNIKGKVYIGESIDGYIYDLNMQAHNDTKLTVAWKSIPYQKYMPGMGNYDIKSAYGNGKTKSYDGYLFHGKYITLREGGNILAGMNAATLGIPFNEFQRLSGALHADGLAGLANAKLNPNYTYGPPPRYGEIDYQYLRSKYGYDFKIQQIKIGQEINLIRNTIDFNKLGVGR